MGVGVAAGADVGAKVVNSSVADVEDLRIMVLLKFLDGV
jgi:hypothetical protein